MSEHLVDAADAAWPPPYADLPATVRVVLGYVGMSGETPHVWSTDEVAACRAAGYVWCPIVVPPQRALTAADGVAAARAMARALPQYGYRPGWPVFCDIERGSYDARPAGAADAVTAWGEHMAAGGWPDAYTYWPEMGPRTWLPDWSGRRPDRLPDGVAGVQYTGNADAGRYDLSVFDPAVFAAFDLPPQGDDVPLSKSDQQWIVAQLNAVQRNLADMIDALHVGKGGSHEWGANMAAVLAAVRAITPTPAGGGMTDAQVGQLADRLAAALNATLPAETVRALADALARAK